MDRNKRITSSMLRKLGVGSFLALLLALAQVSASANTWTYTYTGQALTGDCVGIPMSTPCPPFAATDTIRFRFTTTTPLGDNWNEVTPTGIRSWSLSVGPLDGSSANPLGDYYDLTFSTDASGNITGSAFVTFNPVGNPGEFLPKEYFGSQNPWWENPPYPWYTSEIFSLDYPGLAPVEDGVYIPSIFEDSYQAYNSGTPGNWTVTSTPEPLTMLLVGSGLLGLGGSRLRPLRTGRPGKEKEVDEL